MGQRERVGLLVVVLGDSLSAGVGDPDPGLPLVAGLTGRLHGWPYHLQRLAGGLGSELDVRVLARTGARVAHVRAEQLAAATALSPDVATCFTGVNDVFAPGFDPAAFERDYAATLHGLAAVVRRGVVTLGIHDVTAALPLPPRARQRVRAAVTAADDVVRRVSADAGAWCVPPERVGADLLAGRPVRDGLLSLDRLHPGRVGHARVAAEVARVLQEHALLPPGTLSDLATTSVGARGATVRSTAQVAGAHASHLLWLLRFAPGPLLRGRSLPALLRR